MFEVYPLYDETCDKCNKLPTADDPAIGIEQRGRGHERHVIFVHRSCLYAAIAKAIRTEAEKIDTSDIPEITDWSGARGKFYRRPDAQDLLILEENLKTCLEMKSLPAIPRTIIESMLKKVQDMKR